MGDSLDAQSAQVLCAQLAERKVVSLETAQLMATALSPQALSGPVPEAVKDAQRAKIFKCMLLTVMQQRKPAENG